MKNSTDEPAALQPLLPGLEAMMELRRSIQAPSSPLREYGNVGVTLIFYVSCAACMFWLSQEWSAMIVLIVGSLMILSQIATVIERRMQQRWELVLKVLTEMRSANR